MLPTSRPPSNAPTPAQKELLFKGVTCTLIGAVILLAPYLARASSVRELMAQASIVGWFALVLGLALLGQYARKRLTKPRTDIR